MTHSQCSFNVAPPTGDNRPALTFLGVRGHTLKFLNQTIGKYEWSRFLDPTVYTATANLCSKNPRHSQLSPQQMLGGESLCLSLPAFQSRGGSRSEWLPLLGLDVLRLPLCPEAAPPLPSSLLRNNNDFRGIIRRVGNELLKNGHRIKDLFSLTSLPLAFLPGRVFWYRGADICNMEANYVLTL